MNMLQQNFAYVKYFITTNPKKMLFLVNVIRTAQNKVQIDSIIHCQSLVYEILVS